MKNAAVSDIAMSRSRSATVHATESYSLALLPAYTMFSFGKKKGGKKKLPKGWKKVASKSRPGSFSYVNKYTRTSSVRFLQSLYPPCWDLTHTHTLLQYSPPLRRKDQLVPDAAGLQDTGQPTAPPR